MTLPKVRALYRHFGRHPPVQWMVATYLGVKDPGPAAGPPPVQDLYALFDQTIDVFPG